MSRHILLDSSPLGLLTNPSGSAETLAINQWARDCLVAGHSLYIPEVIDYELRRELLRAGKTPGIALLDGLRALCNYLPITTAAMLRAADLWATARNKGFSTGDPKKLDIDVILAAQALTLPAPPASIIIATSNVTHISFLRLPTCGRISRLDHLTPLRFLLSIIGMPENQKYGKPYNH